MRDNSYAPLSMRQLKPLLALALAVALVALLLALALVVALLVIIKPLRVNSHALGHPMRDHLCAGPAE